MATNKSKDTKQKTNGGLLGFVDIEDKKEEHTINKVLGKRFVREVKKDDKEEIIKKLIVEYAEKYRVSTEMFLDKGYILEPKAFNRCCDLLNEEYSAFDRRVVDILKSVIRSYAVSAVDTIYLFSNTQSVLLHLVSDLSERIEVYDSQKTVDRAYSEILKEFVAVHYMRVNSKKV